MSDLIISSDKSITAKIESNDSILNVIDNSNNIVLGITTFDGTTINIDNSSMSVVVQESPLFDITIQNNNTFDITINSIPGKQGPQGIPGTNAIQTIEVATDWFQEQHTLTQQDITNKYILLQHIVKNPTNLDMMIFGGISQRPFVDFNIIGNKIIWDGLAMELLVDVGVTLSIGYYII